MLFTTDDHFRVHIFFSTDGHFWIASMLCACTYLDVHTEHEVVTYQRSFLLWMNLEPGLLHPK